MKPSRPSQSVSPIPPELALQALREFVDFREGEIVAMFLGTINLIFKIRADSHHYGFRIRVQESIYRYEPNLMKEAVMGALLDQEPSSDTDDPLQALLARLPARGFHTQNRQSLGLLPRQIAWDWTRTTLPYPFCIYEWVEGTPLWDSL